MRDRRSKNEKKGALLFSFAKAEISSCRYSKQILLSFDAFDLFGEH